MPGTAGHVARFVNSELYMGSLSLSSFHLFGICIVRKCYLEERTR